VSPSSEPDEAGPDFAVAAEQRRREGDATAAVALAEQGLARLPNSAQGRVALALALLDAGEPARAKQELERLLESRGVRAPDAPRPAVEPVVPLVQASSTFEDAVADHEIDDAFADAETNPDEMMDANAVVEQTLRGEPLDAIESFDVSEHPTYATQTMAALLEKQGRPAEATALRTSLGDTGPSGDSISLRDGAAAYAGESTPSVAGADAISLEDRRRVATLETWLQNIRRGGHAASQQRGAS
jgi:hypothetical protein